MKKRLLIVACALAALAVAVLPATARQAGAGGGVALKRIGNFDQPVYVTGAPGFPKLLFVVEQEGRIKVLHSGRKLRRSFLNITSLVRDSYEQGLLSVAFPPDYRRSRRFYVAYTDNQGDVNVAEFKRRSATVAARGSRRKVIEIRHRLGDNHNGGQLQFLGHLLYISVGDGGSADDPPDNAKNRRVLLGKILRINPRNPRGPRAYRVPRTNPFVGRPGRNEIFSYGLRNPFRFSFDRISGGVRIAIGDVGQGSFEEIDYETLRNARGAHFGWDEWEGFRPHECDGSCARGTEKPVFAYGRANGCAVIGGYVVRDRRLPSLHGRYVFADLCEGQLRSFAPRLGRVRTAPRIGASVPSPTSFGEDRRGRLYVASLNGPVFRLVPR